MPRSAMLAVVLLLLPTVFAQSMSHEVSLNIPTSIGIRMVGAGAGARAIEFDYANDVGAYLTAADAGVPLVPTSVSRFEDIEVRVNGFGPWSVNVEATALVYAGSGSGAGLALGDVRVDRGSVSGLEQEAIRFFWFIGSYDTSWTLSTTPRQIASTWFATNGWRSLGFNGWDYTLAVDGDEDPGSYSTTVTYSLTFP